MIGFLQSVVHAAAEIYEPDDGIGLAGLLIIGLPTTITAAGTVWVLVRQRKTETKVDRTEGKVDTVQQGIDATNKQVVNGHGNADPLRKDLDVKFAEMGEKLDSMATAIAVETGQRREANRAVGARLDSIEKHLRRG